MLGSFETSMDIRITEAPLVPRLAPRLLIVEVRGSQLDGRVVLTVRLHQSPVVAPIHQHQRFLHTSLCSASRPPPHFRKEPAAKLCAHHVPAPVDGKLLRIDGSTLLPQVVTRGVHIRKVGVMLEHRLFKDPSRGGRHVILALRQVRILRRLPRLHDCLRDRPSIRERVGEA